MVVSIGTKLVGLRQKVSEDTEVKTGVYYETVSNLDKAPATGQELEFLTYVKQKIETEEHVSVRYIEVDGTTLTVQWKSLGSPIAVGVIVALIIAAVVVFGLVLLSREVYQIISFLGPETTGMIFQVLTLFLFLMVMSYFLNLIPRFRRE
jgi:hypothetical protein